MEAGKRFISDIFNGFKILEIPFFQRAYVWKEVQWERFLSDLEHVSATSKPYFMGSVILKQKPTSSGSSGGDWRIVIDGQQRLTTLCIFLKVYSLKTKSPMAEKMLRLDWRNGEIALRHNHNDIEMFNAVLNLTEEVGLDGSDNITAAYQYFVKQINPETINLPTILSNIMFVAIDLSAEEDEQQIFDTINSLGVKLSTAELLKNYFFSSDNYQRYLEDWVKVFEKDEEAREYWDKEATAGSVKRSFIDLLFYSYLQVKIQDVQFNVTGEDKNEFTRVEGLFDSYKNFIGKYNLDKSQVIQEIKQYAILFRNHFDPGILDTELSQSDCVERINALIFGLENSTLIPYVLYVLKNVSNPVERDGIFTYLESYIMRRIICRISSKNYSRLFSEQLISNNVLSKDQLRKYIEKRSEQSSYIPGDDELKKAFQDTKLVNNQAAGILYFIESKIRNRKKYSTALLGLNSYSLEHLMPKKWENNWDKVGGEEAKITRNKKLLTLGNLAIITGSLNSSIRDGDWTTKRIGKPDKPGLDKYAAGMATLDKYLDFPDWAELHIADRADFLYQEAAKIWPVN